MLCIYVSWRCSLNFLYALQLYVLLGGKSEELLVRSSMYRGNKKDNEKKGTRSREATKE